MAKIIFILSLAILYSGCASTSTNSPLKKKVRHAEKYANNMGCKVLSNGYMVCPKSMTR